MFTKTKLTQNLHTLPYDGPFSCCGYVASTPCRTVAAIQSDCDGPHVALVSIALVKPRCVRFVAETGMKTLRNLSLCHGHSVRTMHRIRLTSQRCTSTSGARTAGYAPFLPFPFR